MEYTAFAIVLLASLLIVISTLIFKSLLLWNQFKAVPGPRPRLPIFGNVWLFYRPEIPLSQLVDVIFRDLSNRYRKDGMFALLFGAKVVLYLVKPKYAAEFLKDNSLVNKASEYDIFKIWLGNGLITANGKNWKNQRRLLMPTFHSKLLEDYIPAFNEQSLKLIIKLREAINEPYVDIRPLMSETTLNIISVTAMGISLEEQSQDVKEYRECLKRVPTVIVSRVYNPLNWIDFIFYRRNIGKQLLRDIKTMQSFTRNVINRRKINFKPGLAFSESKPMAFLDLLLTLQFEDKSITDEEIQEDVETFMFAGHDTTSICLTWTLLLLGNHPECQRKVIQEINAIFGDDRRRHVNKDDINHMQYTECVIKESLRMFPPVPIFGRVTTTDVLIGGHKFPKETSVFILVQEVHKDEDSFPNPFDFIPERFENHAKIPIGLAPFAIGPRNCIGQRFAMFEMKVILAQIFRNFTIKCLDEVSDVKVSIDVTLQPLSPIRITFHPL